MRTSERERERVLPLYLVVFFFLDFESCGWMERTATSCVWTRCCCAGRVEVSTTAHIKPTRDREQSTLGPLAFYYTRSKKNGSCIWRGVQKETLDWLYSRLHLSL